MDMLNLVMPILQNTILALIIIMIPCIVKQIKLYLQNKTNNQKIRDAIDLIGDIVIEINQTYVDDLKNKNMFTEAAQKEAFTKAYNKAQYLIASETKDLVKKYYNDFDKWLTSQIESSVYYN